MTNDLRLLLDECLQGELAEEIGKWGKVRAQWVCEDVSLRSQSVTDEFLMSYAQARGLILVTVEGRLNERKFEICTHHGIIVFKAAKRHASAKAQIFKKLMLSGRRSLCKHAVTYLKTDEIVFRRKSPTDGELMDIRVRI